MDYKDTLNLPKTAFPMKANLPQKEVQFLKRWEDQKLYHAIIQKNKNNPSFVLHDGPPYANTPIHIGTALNKILKDIVLKYKNMTGHKCDYIPGWDCHGLPIELQAIAKQKKKDTEASSPLEIRELCREHATKYIDIQREQFKRLGVFADWQNPYLTMSLDYESTIVREFGKLFSKNLLYKGKKVIHWCASCRTALAEAEIEYETKTSPSIYVKFPLKKESLEKLGGKLSSLKDKNIFVLIWTTTPWTLPANLAIAVHPKASYVAVQVPRHSEQSEESILILAEDLLEKVKKECDLKNISIVEKFTGSDISSLSCRHPFLEKDSIILMGDHVDLETGTGCVHTAPGHGEEDYHLGLKYKLDIFSPVDNRGRFTEEIPEFKSMFVFDTNPLIIQKLSDLHLLLKEKTIAHSYPHCWRCKKPVLFRATQQWFLLMDKEPSLRKEVLEWIDKVQWIPSWGKNRIQGMMEMRPDWCLSRQRVWGVPIPAIYCKKCLHIVTDHKFISKMADIFEKKGTDYWFKASVQELLSSTARCPSCDHAEFEKETDILDVWFDSGSSFAAVLEKREGLNLPADLYLEGSDQHRGWFHTSLLISTATRHIAPYKAVLTHGFVVDGSGKKMSKSLGNVVEPEKVISQHGAEILRLWTASEDYRNDVHCSSELMERIADSYRKIRNTCRHMLGNLSDFDPKKDSISYKELLEIDQWILLKCQRLIEKIQKAYKTYEFHLVFQFLNNFCITELSSLYLDILKDRLYTFKSKGKERLAAQTTLYEVLSTLTRIMAPVLSFTAEEIYDELPAPKELSIHLTPFPSFKKEYINEELEQRWEKLLELRLIVAKALEEIRQKKIIGNSLEAKVTLCVDQEWKAILDQTSFDLTSLFIVSQVEVKTAQKLKIEAVKAEGQKCERCWMWSESVTNIQTICDKCKRQL